MPDPSHHGGGVDQGRETDPAEEGQPQVEAEAGAGPGVRGDPRDTVEVRAAPGDLDLALKVVRGTGARRSGNSVEAKVALNQDKVAPNLNPGPRRKIQK